MIKPKTLFKRYPDILVCFFLVIVTLSVYWQVKGHKFVNFDDDRYVSDNMNVKNGLTSKGFIWSLTATHASNWHPLTWLSHMLDVQIYGLEPGRHHLTSVIFHILNTILLFIVLRQSCWH